MQSHLLLTIDFEMTGYETGIPSSRFPLITRSLLQWLDSLEVKSTFFCVGHVLEKHPELIQAIAASGHEIAAHGWRHTPLDKLTSDDLKKDLDLFLDCANKLGLNCISGYRAPFFSLTSKTQWALDIIRQAGFSYDSSMLPARTILYGFPDANPHPHRLDNGLIEIPITVWQPLSGFGFKSGIPILGGTYLRLLPHIAIKQLINRPPANNKPLVGYFHPYDIDTELNGVNAFDNNPIYNALLNIGQKNMRQKINLLLKDRKTQTIASWIDANRESLQ